MHINLAVIFTRVENRFIESGEGVHLINYSNVSGWFALFFFHPLTLSISERMWLNSELSSNNIALLPLSNIPAHMHTPVPPEEEFSVLSVAVSCEGEEAGPQECSRHGRGGREHL